jgi:hypothetical protein
LTDVFPKWVFSRFYPKFGGFTLKRFVRYAMIAVVTLFLLLQLVPVDRTNPPIMQEVQWDSQETRELAQRACFDCHSNETIWPWYSYVLPISLRVVNHVDHGRFHLNFSQWDDEQEELDEVIEAIEEGEMPLRDYMLLHPEARLTDAETAQLIAGFKATFQNDPPIERGHEHEHEDDEHEHEHDDD